MSRPSSSSTRSSRDRFDGHIGVPDRDTFTTLDGLSKAAAAPGIVGVAAGSPPGSATSTVGSILSEQRSESSTVDVHGPGHTPAKALVSGSALEQKRFPPWLIISTWIGLSTGVIFYNVLILRDWNFPYPITLTTLHLAFQSIATQLLARYTDLVPSPNSSASSNSSSGNSAGKDYIPLPNLTPTLDSSFPHHRRSGSGAGPFFNGAEDSKRYEPPTTPGPPQDDSWAYRFRVRQRPTIDQKLYWKRIVPIGFLFSVSLVLSNAVYLYLSVAFIQMIKSASPIAVLITNFAWGLRPLSFRLLGIVGLISLGICIASYGEVAFSTVGFVIQCVAIMVEANRVVLIQMLLQGEGMTPITSLYFFAPVCLTINAMFILPMEGWKAIYAIPELGFFVIFTNGLATLLLNLSAVYLIQLSSLILSLSKVVKDLVLIFGSGLVLGTPIEPLQWLGYSIALVGLIGYKMNS